MSHSFYLAMHVIGVIGLFMAFGAAALHSAAGGTKVSNPYHKALSAGHGIALLLILVAGFGMIARLGAGFPPWVIVKIVIWFALGGLMTPLGRAAGSGRSLWAVVFVLGALAAWFGVYKPFGG
jgi:hypothetical protein